jgi:hypothetical protein
VILRRLAALTTGLLLLRLNFVAVDLTCAEHETPLTAVTAAAIHDHGVDLSHEQADSATDAGEKCEAPVRADCCDAYVSCSIVLVDDRLAAANVVLPDSGALLSLGIDRPASRHDAPEPPPPKAYGPHI